MAFLDLIGTELLINPNKLNLKNALTTTELITLVLQKCNESIDAINNLQTNTNNYTDSKINELLETVNNFKKELEIEQTIIVNNASYELRQEFTRALNTLETKIDNVKNDLILRHDLDITLVREEHARDVAILEDMISSNETIVKHPLNGENVKLEDILLECLSMSMALIRFSALLNNKLFSDLDNTKTYKEVTSNIALLEI